MTETELLTKSSPEFKNPETLKLEAKQALEKYAKDYDFTSFSWTGLYQYLQQFRTEIQSENNVHEFDLHSFEVPELESTWNFIDQQLTLLKEKYLANIKEGSEAHRLLNLTPKAWEMDFDGNVKPYVENPVLLGGVHGDEITLPQEMKRLLKANTDNGQYFQLSGRALVNSHVNIYALEHNVRAFSPTAQRADNTSDLNRTNIVDIQVLELKSEIIAEIQRLDQPFIIDMHNDNLAENTEGTYLAFTTESGPQMQDALLFKLRLAQELGIAKVIMVDPKIAEGTLVMEAAKGRGNINGMVIEVPGGDTAYTSAKIALRYLALCAVVNNGRPSAGIQLQHELSGPFLEPKSEAEMQIQYYRALTNGEQPKQNDGKNYAIFNGIPIEIQDVKLT